MHSTDITEDPHAFNWCDGNKQKTTEKKFLEVL